MVDDGYDLLFSKATGKNCVTFFRPGVRPFTVECRGGLYSLARSVGVGAALAGISDGGVAELLHRGCGHVGWYEW